MSDIRFTTDGENTCEKRGTQMMDHGMMQGGGMMWGMGVIGLLVVIALILLIAALMKYLFFR